jgi:hypothetical protein
MSTNPIDQMLLAEGSFADLVDQLVEQGFFQRAGEKVGQAIGRPAGAVAGWWAADKPEARWRGREAARSGPEMLSLKDFSKEWGAIRRKINGGLSRIFLWASNVQSGAPVPKDKEGIEFELWRGLPKLKLLDKRGAEVNTLSWNPKIKVDGKEQTNKAVPPPPDALYKQHIAPVMKVAEKLNIDDRARAAIQLLDEVRHFLPPGFGTEEAIAAVRRHLNTLADTWPRVRNMAIRTESAAGKGNIRNFIRAATSFGSRVSCSEVWVIWCGGSSRPEPSWVISTSRSASSSSRPSRRSSPTSPVGVTRVLRTTRVWPP